MYTLPIKFKMPADSAESAMRIVEEALPDMVDGSDFAVYAVMDAVADGNKLYDGEIKIYGYVVTVDFGVFANDADHAKEAGEGVADSIFSDTKLSGYSIGDATSDGLNEQDDGTLA